MKKFVNVMLMALLVLVTGVTAQAQDFATIDRVEVNDIVVFDTLNGQPVEVVPAVVERGSTVKVEVYFTGIVETDDARLEVSLGGYEYGVPRAVSPIFTVRKEAQDRKVFTLEVPQDLKGSKDYTLRVELFDDETVVSETFDLRIEEVRHLVNVFDATFSPGSRVVKAGQPLFVSVMLENLGENVEERIKVVASVPAFGLREETWVNELVTSAVEHEDRDFFLDEEDSQIAKELALMIPEDAQPGDYELKLRVEYNRGHSVEEKSYVVRVNGAPQTPVQDEEALVVNVDSLNKNVNVGQNAVFTFNVANLGQTTRVFEVQVLGTESFGSARADPQVLTVPKDQTAEAFVAVTAAQGTGPQSFTVRLVENGKTVKEVSLTANVQQAPAVTGTDSFKNVLEIGFVVLLVILVVLGLVIVIKRLSEDGSEEPVEGQTYY